MTSPFEEGPISSILNVTAPSTAGAVEGLFVNGVATNLAPMGQTQVGIIQLRKNDRVAVGNAGTVSVYLVGEVTATGTVSGGSFEPVTIIGPPSSSVPVIIASLMLELLDH